MAHRKARFIVTTLLALVTGTAAASDWQPVASSSSNTFLVDAASIVREGPIVRAWVRGIYGKSTVGQNGAKVWAVLGREYFDCVNRRLAIRQTTEFADTNFEEVLLVGPTTPDALLDWSDVAPDSISAALLEFVCSLAPPK